MIQKKKSHIHGYGIFATQPINKNTKIIQYTGERIPREEGIRRDALYLKNGELWTFEIDPQNWIDGAVGGGIARYVNHSDTPNCWIYIKNGEIWYRASRLIPLSEELTVDYGTPLPHEGKS